MELAMNEKQEAIIRQQALLMVERNHGKMYVIRKVYKRFLKCLKG